VVTDGGDGSDDDSGDAMHEVLRSDYDLCVCRQTSKQPSRRKSDQMERMKRGT
jgi:hypothetical protein